MPFAEIIAGIVGSDLLLIIFNDHVTFLRQREFRHAINIATIGLRTPNRSKLTVTQAARRLTNFDARGSLPNTAKDIPVVT